MRIERLPSYLSPSSLMQAENMPNTFYLTRLIADRMEREPQGLAAAVGSAFDYYIKMLLFEKKFGHKELKLLELKKGIETNIEEAFRAGKSAFRTYKESAFNLEEYYDVELSLQKDIEGVPLLGKLDASCKDIRSNDAYKKVIPFDWKTTGYTSKSTTSPPKGYYRKWMGTMPKPSHKLFEPEIPFELINKKWSVQMCTYGWLMGYEVGEPFYGRIDVLIWNKGVVNQVTQYRGLITPEYQRLLIERYKKVWNDLTTSNFLDRLGSKTDEDLVWIASRDESWF